jgi:hypothetical protein
MGLWRGMVGLGFFGRRGGGWCQDGAEGERGDAIRITFMDPRPRESKKFVLGTQKGLDSVV